MTMKDNESVLEAELEYAVRMVRAGYASVEQAARVCGVRLSDLEERLKRRGRPVDGDASALPDAISFLP